MPRTISTYSGKSLALELRVRLVEQLMSYGDGTSELEVAEITLLIDNLDDLLDLGPRLDLLYPAGKLENAGIHDSYAGHIVAPRFLSVVVSLYLTHKSDMSTGAGL